MNDNRPPMSDFGRELFETFAPPSPQMRAALGKLEADTLAEMMSEREAGRLLNAEVRERAR